MKTLLRALIAASLVVVPANDNGNLSNQTKVALAEVGSKTFIQQSTPIEPEEVLEDMNFLHESVFVLRF